MADYEELPYIVVERRSGGFGAFLWGALIGAGVALLLAPKSGKEMRRDLRENAERLRRSAESALREVQESVATTVEDLRDQVSDRVASARQAVEAGREAARRARAELERRVESAREQWGRGNAGGDGEAELAEGDFVG
ncbi:MAG: YtxH domain-containing protein [Gemmatimonadota bacterium]|jgi:gas vesicle protein